MTCHRVSFVIVACLGTLLSCKGQENRANLASMPMDNTASSEFKAHTENASQDFIVFDGMHLRNKPAEIAEAGLVPIKIIYARPIFGENPRRLRRAGSMDLPSRERVSRIARRISREGHRWAIIDIEHWPLRGRNRVGRSLENYMTVLEWFREAAPEVEWGYYGVVPQRNDLFVMRPRSTRRHQAWMRANDHFGSLANSVDALFPTIYVKRDTDPERWVELAERYIAEARRLNPGAPVYPFLWPQYHDGSGRPIEPDFWRLQLETVRRLADGAVIWHTGRYRWDSGAPWWQETKEFMQELAN